MTQSITPAVLFDLDGTLIDPFIGIARSYRNICNELGLAPLTDDEVRPLIGPPIQEAIHQQFHLTGEDLNNAVRTYREYYSTTGVYEFTPIPGIAELVEELSERGFEVDVATSKPTVYAQQIIEIAGWHDVISHIGGAELDGSRRHKADVIAWVLERLQPNVQAVTFVGDRPEDVLGATAHHLACIGVNWGFASIADLVTAGALQIVSSVADLKEALLLLGSL